MKILVPTADYPPIEGGISTVALQVSRELAKMGHEVTVVAPHFRGWDDFDRGEPYGVIRYRGYGLGWLRLAPMMAASWRHLRETDLVLAINISYGGLIGYVGARNFGRRYVAFAYAYEFMKFRRTTLAGAIYRKIYADARAVVAISNFTRDNLVQFGVDAETIRVILPGATPADAVPAETVAAVRRKYALDDDRLILCVGRFISRKNHVMLVRAMPKILERIPNAVLALVGRGPTTRQCLQEALALGVRDHIVFPGYVPDDELAALYQACDVFALPAGTDRDGNAEGFGLVFSEAHARGKPVVGGRAGGIPDAVIDGETGLLVDLESANQAIVVPRLADAIVRLMEDSELARRLGENGRRRIETELNWRHFTEELMRAVTS